MSFRKYLVFSHIFLNLLNLLIHNDLENQSELNKPENLAGWLYKTLVIGKNSRHSDSELTADERQPFCFYLDQCDQSNNSQYR